MKINLIVPAVSGGVTDYAHVLVEALSAMHEVSIFTLSQQMSEIELDAALEADCVYIHYSGYGFATRGAPFWLLLALRRRRDRIKHLCIFFHELFAFKPPWSSAFWLSPLQRHIASSMARLSDAWLTNRQVSADWLLARSSPRPNAVLPVFSNVGEQEKCPVNKQRRVVIFGSEALRASTYHAAGAELFSWAAEHSLDVHDIGPPLKDPNLGGMLIAHGVTCHGRQSPIAVSAILSSSQYGVLAYHPDYVAKSGVFAAFSAHAVLPILICEHSCEHDGLIADVNYLHGLPSEMIDDAARTALAQSAWCWYQPHCIRAHADSFNALLAKLDCL